MDSVVYIYLWGEPNAKLHQGPLLPVSFLRGWISTSPLRGCSLQWSFVSHLSVACHNVSWIDPPSLSVMISGFISVCEDSILSDFKPWFKIHFRPISHFFIHSSVQVRYLYFHLFDVVNGATGPGLGGCGVWSLFAYEIFQERTWFLILSLPLYLFVCFSLMGLHFSNQAHSTSYQVHPISTLKRLLYQCHSAIDAMSSFWQWPF